MTNFDLPKTKIKDDELGYSYLAYQVARIIKLAKPSDCSFVIGICGHWGDGKTTLINYVQKILKYFLKNQSTDIDDYRKTIELIKNNEIDNCVECSHVGENKKPIFNVLHLINVLVLVYFIIYIVYFNYYEAKAVLFFRHNLLLLISLIALLINFNIIRSFIFKNINSLFESIKNNLKDTPDENKNEEIVILNFNPWHFQKTDDIILNFFKCLSKNIKISGLDKDNELINKLSIYASLLTGIDVPKVETSQIDINQIKCEIYNILSESDTKFLVIIDDLDRLQPQDVLAIFKAVKLLADFPNIIYLLSYDDNKLLNQHSFFKENYIQKIVQLEKKLPTISKAKIKEIFINRIFSIIGNENLIDKDKLIKFFDFSIYKLMKNIRDINRFDNSFKLTYFAHENINEINLLDFILISILAELDKEAYSLIQANKDVIFDTISAMSMRKHVDFINQIKNCPGFLLIGALFSNYFCKLSETIDTILKDSKSANSLLDVPQHELTSTQNSIKYKFTNFINEDIHRKICNKDSFDNYFLPNISVSLILNDEFESLLDSTNNNEQFNKNFKDIFSLNQDKIVDFKQRLLKSEFITSKENICNFVNAFYSIDDELIAQLYDFREFVEFQLKILQQQKLLTKNELIDILSNASKDSNIIQLIHWYHELNMSNIDNYFREDFFNSTALIDMKNIIINKKVPTNFYGEIIIELLIILGIQQIKNLNSEELKTLILENQEYLKLLLRKIKYNTLDYKFYFSFEEIQDCLINEFIKTHEDENTSNFSFCQEVAVPILSENLDGFVNSFKNNITNSMNFCKQTLNHFINNYVSINDSTSESNRILYTKNYNQAIEQFEKDNLFTQFFNISNNELILKYVLIKLYIEKDFKNNFRQAIKINEDVINKINEIESGRLNSDDAIKRLKEMINIVVK